MEAVIRASFDDLWRHTRSASRHQRWDLRFSEITHVDVDGDAVEPTVFRYATRLVPGFVISGTGVTAGDRRRDGAAVSALRFSSDHPLSPIRDGRGYWRYTPTPNGMVFATGYDYTPGFGGRALDVLFRPAITWATAWSFDRLRLWLETGAPPEQSLRRAQREVALRVGVVSGVAAVTRFAPCTYAVALACVFLPPGPRTPAARRCVRGIARPRGRRPGRHDRQETS
ncbi:hypothetical protein OG216_46155 (plasmid) [Streptomycetaceae bacterium NBC_01309]